MWSNSNCIGISSSKNAGILIDNIFVAIAGHVFQQSVGIPVGTYCTPFIFKWGGIHQKTYHKKLNIAKLILNVSKTGKRLWRFSSFEWAIGV
jgi:hypothetical protein